RDADADLARIRQDIVEAAPDLVPAPADRPAPPGGSRGSIPRAAVVLFALLGLLVALLPLRPWGHQADPPPPARGGLPSLHTGARCPAKEAICFYKQRGFNGLLGWFSPRSCDGTYPMLWQYIAASVQNRSRCRVFLLSCPGECWHQWLGPGSDNGALDPPDAADRIRLTSNVRPAPTPPPSPPDA